MGHAEYLNWSAIHLHKHLRDTLLMPQRILLLAQTRRASALLSWQSSCLPRDWRIFGEAMSLYKDIEVCSMS